MRHGRKASSQSGMTMVELLFVIALLATATVSIANFVKNTRQAVSRQEAAGALTQLSLRIVTNLRAGLQSCDELIANYGLSDVTSDAMLPIRSLLVASVKASGAPIPVSFSGWPTVQNIPQVDMNGPSDASAIAWGNEIMYVAQLNPITFTAYYTQSGSNWVVASASASTSTIAEAISLPRLQFVYDYLSWNTGTAIAGSGKGLRLAEWRSQPYIEYSALSSLSDLPSSYIGNTCCPRLLAACADLTSTGFSTAFDPTAITESAGANCFYLLGTESNITNGIPEALPSTLPMGSWAYLDDFEAIATYGAKGGVNQGRIALAGGGAIGEISANSGYSVAFNVSGTTGTATSVVALEGPGGLLQVPAYAQANYAMPDSMGGAGFPAGFEVTVDGEAGSREIVIRLVLMVSNAGNSKAGTLQASQQLSEISIAPQSDF